MTFLQAVLTAIFQGVTELFPVSSLGHAVILPAVLGWNIHEFFPSIKEEGPQEPQFPWLF